MCSERQIAICAILKAWLCEGSWIWPKCDITKTNEGSCIVYITEKVQVQVDRLVSYRLVFIHLRTCRCFHTQSKCKSFPRACCTALRWNILGIHLIWKISFFYPLCCWWLIWPVQNDAKNLRNWLKPWHMGTDLRVLSESSSINTNMIGFRWFSKIFVSLCSGRK